MSSKLLVQIVVSAVIFVLIVKSGRAQLQVGFYEDSCAVAESIVREEVEAAFTADRGVAAGLIRLHFHDCFVRGCDGSVLIDTTDPDRPAEKEAKANKPSLRGFEAVDSIKTRLEAACPGVVSCADILAFAARDSVEITEGIGYAVPAGRRDGITSRAEDVDVPKPSDKLDQLTRQFAGKGLSPQEMVALSGAHTLGRSHCSSFSKRLYFFNSSSGSDPTLDATYTRQLKQQCPKGANTSQVVVEIDVTPATLDASYYRGLRMNRGLFTSDQALLTDTNTAAQVSLYAQQPQLWKKDFAAAMVSMGYIGVLTGSEGEIRKNCRLIN